MAKLINLYLLFFFTFTVLAQKKMDRTIRTLNRETVPYIHISEAQVNDGSFFLDTRKFKEFEVSHIENAVWVGYDQFNPQIVQQTITDYNTPIIVYCSIGIRSEDIGEKLLKLGYTNIKNLYGGIFKWKNQGFPVFDMEGNETEKVHAFGKFWGKLLTKGEKVYD